MRAWLVGSLLGLLHADSTCEAEVVTLIQRSPYGYLSVPKLFELEETGWNSQDVEAFVTAVGIVESNLNPQQTESNSMSRLHPGLDFNAPPEVWNNSLCYGANFTFCSAKSPVGDQEFRDTSNTSYYPGFDKYKQEKDGVCWPSGFVQHYIGNRQLVLPQNDWGGDSTMTPPAGVPTAQVMPTEAFFLYINEFYQALGGDALVKPKIFQPKSTLPCEGYWDNCPSTSELGPNQCTNLVPCQCEPDFQSCHGKAPGRVCQLSKAYSWALERFYSSNPVSWGGYACNEGVPES